MDSRQKHAGMTFLSYGHFIVWGCTKVLKFLFVDVHLEEFYRPVLNGLS